MRGKAEAEGKSRGSTERESTQSASRGKKVEGAWQESAPGRLNVEEGGNNHGAVRERPRMHRTKENKKKASEKRSLLGSKAWLGESQSSIDRIS